MSVAKEKVVPGAVFRFSRFQRRVIEITKPAAVVRWEYADGQKRAGKLGGRQWLYNFVLDAEPLDAGQVKPTYSELESQLIECRSRIAWLEKQLGEGVVDKT